MNAPREVLEFIDLADVYHAVIQAGGRVAQAMIAFRTFLGENPGAPGLAYLANMAPRLVELRRVLKPTGSIYLHCDLAASHSIIDGALLCCTW